MVAVGCLMLIFLIAFFVIKGRKQEMQIEIPRYEARQITIKELATDANIFQISEDELEIGSKIAIGSSGDVRKGFWKKNGEHQEVAIKHTSIQTQQSDSFFYEIKLMRYFVIVRILKLLF